MKRTILTSFLFAFLFSGCGEDNTPPTTETTTIEQPNKLVDFNQLNLESISIAEGILENPKTYPILSKEVVASFVTQGVGDFDIEKEPFIDYISRNNSHIKTLIENLKKKTDASTEEQINIRIEISKNINERLKKLYTIITNYSKELKKLNKKLLEYDFKLKEKISLWTFVSKENNIEDEMGEIITDILQEEYSLENKLKFLFGSWLNENTKNKLEIYFNIHQDFDTAYNNLKNVDLIIQNKYPGDYKYADDYLKKLKNKKI